MMVMHVITTYSLNIKKKIKWKIIQTKEKRRGKEYKISRANKNQKVARRLKPKYISTYITCKQTVSSHWKTETVRLKI